MDEVPTQAPDIVVSLSDASDSDLTANLIDALRAARVEVCCPSEAAVRAENGAGLSQMQIFAGCGGLLFCW